MKLMITNRSSGPAKELLANLHEPGRNEERRVTRSHKELGQLQARRKPVQTLSSLRQERPYPQREPFLRMRKKWIAIHAQSRNGVDLAV